MISYSAFRDEVEKIAARRGVKEIAKLVQMGEHGIANRIAKTPGVLKPSAAGSAIRDLGMGAEGLATLVAHPEHGVSVRKLYNPNGLSSPAMIARKELAGRAMGANQNIAQFHGSATTPHGASMHFNEYVPGQSASALGIGPKSREFQEARKGSIRALRGAGFRGGEDIRPGNMIKDTRTGTLKTIDYLPSRDGEFAKPPARIAQQHPRNTLFTTPSSSGLFQGNHPQANMTSGQLKATAFRGVTPALPGARPQRSPSLTPTPVRPLSPTAAL